MDILPKSESDKLYKYATEAITLVRSNGMSPDEALTKVASENKLGVEFISRLSEMYNKSAAVSHLQRNPAETRGDSFPIADARKIASAVFKGGQQKTAALVNEIPSRDFSQISAGPEQMQKTASAVALAPATKNLFVSENARIIESNRLRDMRQKVASQATSRRQETQYHLEKSLQKVANEVKKLSPVELKKVAQYVTNAYTKEQSSSFLRLVDSWVGRDILPSGLQKSANSVIFPAQEPYVSIQSCFDWAQKHAASVADVAYLQKSALLGVGSSAGAVAEKAQESLLGNVMGGITEAGKGKQGLDDVLDSRTYNQSREIESMGKLYNLVLTDDAFHNYPLEDVVKSYNNVVSVIPEAYENQGTLRNLMLSNLNSGGVMDVNELGQIGKLREGQLKIDAQKVKDLDDSKEKYTKEFDAPAGLSPKDSFTSKHAPAISGKGDALMGAFGEDKTKKLTAANTALTKKLSSSASTLGKVQQILNGATGPQAQSALQAIQAAQKKTP
jgi:hypothetical protein